MTQKAKNHGSKPLQFSSQKFFLNFKRVLEDMKTRFFICIWFFRISKKFLTILFHKKTKIITHLNIFGPKKACRTEFRVLGPNFWVQFPIAPTNKNFETFNSVSSKGIYLAQKKKLWATDSENICNTLKFTHFLLILRTNFAKLNVGAFL